MQRGGGEEVREVENGEGGGVGEKEAEILWDWHGPHLLIFLILSKGSTPWLLSIQISEPMETILIQTNTPT